MNSLFTKKPLGLLTATLALVMLAAPASAYVGPGAGISAIGSLFSLLAAIGLAIVGFIWYPIKRLLRALRPASRPTEDAPDKAS